MKGLMNIIDLSIGYDDKVLVSGINAGISKGERIAILGLNGSGKSTLLYTICGRHGALEGSVLIDDQRIEKLNALDRAKHIAMVASSAENPGQLKVIDLVAFGRYPYTSSLNQLKNVDLDLIQKAISSVGIGKLKDRFFNELSDGEKQKVLLAAAIAQQSELLILDEPTSHLDIRNKIVIMELISTYAEEEDKAILFTTHDLGLAKNVATRIWLIHEGVLKDIPSSDFEKEAILAPLLDGLDKKYTNWF